MLELCNVRYTEAGHDLILRLRRSVRAWSRNKPCVSSAPLIKWPIKSSASYQVLQCPTITSPN
jgi:hypothetical protein